MMLAMVTFVATLVAVYASGYMAGDPAYPRFFAVVGLFVFSMTGLVLSSNYLLTYAFWEGVGVCSYLLVGFWHAKPEASAAAKKAFLVNRVGDVGFAIAIFWIWAVSPNHDLSYATFLSPESLKLIPASAQVGIPLLLFWAATAKSAQVPLYVWLPDAMEGPTPVSALIHAATMVTAGVYLVARSSPLLILVPGVQLTVSVIGCVTALLAAAIALTQTDLKRVLAYSTVSQLGYMFMALGAGVKGVGEVAVIAGMFHLFTHAFFKALLFLAAGSVMHAMGGVIDMREFSGLRHRLPRTHWTFAVGALALAGLPPLAGFFSKDEVLASLKIAAQASNASGGSGWGWVYYLIYGMAVLTALLTAFYTGRAYFLTFWGPERLPAQGHDSHGHDEHGHGGHDSHFGHESPSVMTTPLAILAVCAVGVGLLFGPTHFFEHHVEATAQLHSLEEVAALGGSHVETIPVRTDWASILLGTTAGLLGLGLSYSIYARRSSAPSPVSGALAPAYRASLNKFYVDELYDAVVILPTRVLGYTADFLDKYVVANLVWAVSAVPGAVGKYILGRRQNGLLQYYAGYTALVTAFFYLLLVFWVF